MKVTYNRHLRVALDRALDVKSVSVAGVSVPYARDVPEGGADVGGGGQHFGVGQELRRNQAGSSRATYKNRRYSRIVKRIAPDALLVALSVRRRKVQTASTNRHIFVHVPGAESRHLI